MSDKCLICQRVSTECVFHRTLKDRKFVNIDVCERCHRSLVEKVHDHGIRAKKMGARDTLTTAQWIEKLRLSQGYCHYCTQFVGCQNLTLDHMMPITCGGDNSVENVVPVCRSCNSRKGTMGLEQWKMRRGA
jgi:5-methylcytosine-specific restriction enzyme A